MLTKAERRKIALKNLAKARKARKRNPVRGRRRGMRDEFAPDYYDYSADEADRRAALDAKAAKKAAAKAKREEKKAAAEAKRAEKKARVKAAAANDTAKPKKAEKAAKKSAKKPTERSKPVAKPTKASKSAKKNGSKRGKKLTKAERAEISRRNLKKARAARKAGKVAAPKKSGTRAAKKSTSTLTKRQLAARKAARARKRRPATARLTRKNRAVTVNVVLKPTKAQKRRMSGEGRKGSGRRKNNPLTGGADWGMGLLGFTFGGISVGFFDRLAATHALTQGATAGAWNDAPAAGQLYNAEAVQAPIWSNITRMLVAAVAIATPFGIAAAVKGPKVKTFFQLFGFGSLAVTAVKGANDLIALAASNSSYGARLYAPELMAQQDSAALTANGSPLPALVAPVHTTVPASNPPSLAGIPRHAPARLNAFPQANPVPVQNQSNAAVRALYQTPPPAVRPAAPQGVAGLPDINGSPADYLREDFGR